MSTIATTIAGPKTYSAEELQALHLAMNAKAKRKKMLQKTALVTMNLDRKSTRLNSSHIPLARMQSSA